jgi:hypothetical protein
MASATSFAAVPPEPMAASRAVEQAA